MLIGTDVAALQQDLQTMRVGQERPTSLEEACRQFEGLLLGMILKDGLRDVFRESAEGGGGMESFKDFCVEQVADSLAAEGSLGIANSLMGQFEGTARTAGGRGV